MVQVSSDYLRELLEKYEKHIIELNAALTLASDYNNKLALCKAEIAKLNNMKDLVIEQIRTEKILIRASQDI